MAETIPAADAIRAWLVSKLSERLDVGAQEIDVREPFSSYGLGSTEAVSLAGELTGWLGRKLSPALVYEYPTIEALARYLAESPELSEPVTAAGQEQGGNRRTHRGHRHGLPISRRQRPRRVLAAPARRGGCDPWKSLPIASISMRSTTRIQRRRAR